MSGEKLDSMACGKCGNEAMGRFDAAFLQKMGWRLMDGKWTCSACTGLLWTQLEDKPHVLKWLAEQKAKMEAADAPSLLDIKGIIPKDSPERESWYDEENDDSSDQGEAPPKAEL